MQSSSQAVRAKEDEPFLERFIEAHEGFILRTASRHAGHTVTRSDDEYSVALMASCSPKSDKTRRGCGMAAAALSRSSVLAASLRRTHELPVRALAKESGVSARLIERHRNYIVAAALLLDGDYPVLSSYLGSIRRYLHEAEGQNGREAAVCAQS